VGEILAVVRVATATSLQPESLARLLEKDAV
jgi:hypothetical protein